MGNSSKTIFVGSAIAAVMLAALPLRAQSDHLLHYYLLGVDAVNKSSLTSGGNSAVGWATTLDGVRAKNGVDNANAIYHVPYAYLIRTATSGDQTFGGYRLVFDGTCPTFMLKNNGKTQTIGRLTIASGTQADFLAGAAATFYLAGAEWLVEENAVLGLGASVDTAGRHIVCSATLSGAGTIAVIGNGAYAGSVTLSGDLSGFTGRLNAALPKLSTANGTYGAANLSPSSHTLIIAATSAFPVQTPGNDMIEDAVSVHSGATLRFSCDVTSPAVRGWDLGSGAAPTICVDAGKTVTILGPVKGTAGFNKTGSGTLVLNVGGNGRYDTISLTGESTVSAARLAEYVSACETWLSELPAEISAPAAVTISDNSLALSSRIHNLPSGANATLSFAYGITPTALLATNTVPTTATASPVSLGTNLTRLTPGTAYYIKALLVTDEVPPTRAESPVVCIQTADANFSSRVEYIEGTGTQYIDTDYTPTPTTRTLLDLQLTAVKGQYRLFGTEVAVSGHLVYCMYVNGTAATSGSFAYSRQNDAGNWTGLVAADTARHTFDFNHPNGTGRAITISGTTINKRAIGNTATVPAQHSLYLGAPNEGGWTANNAISKHRIYSCQMYEGDTLVRDFIPEVRNGVAGLYDVVEDVFHPSVSADAYLAGPALDNAIAATETLANGGLSSIDLSFAAAEAPRNLRVAWGPASSILIPADWYATSAVATIAAGDTTFSYAPPANWGSDTNLVMRFYFDGTSPVEWSDAIYWRDYALPSVTDVALDGMGGDTLVVTGNLAAFPGANCSLTVYTGTSPTALDNAWTGLANAVRDATGAFTLTLFEPDTTAARYIVPGSTLYVTVEAVADGKVSRTEPVAVDMAGAPTFASAASSVNRRTVTFTGSLSDVGAMGEATITLYVGAETDDEADLVAVESPHTVTDNASFSVTHVFDNFETTYRWQFRAVATPVGATTTCETRSALLTAHTLDTTTYTWKTSVTSGDWSDAVNWTNDRGGDCLGYPQSAAASAVFVADTTATVRFTEALTINALNMAAKMDVAFVQGGASAAATKLTANTVTMHNNQSSGGRITLDGVAIKSNSGLTAIDTYRELHLVNGADLYVASVFYNQVSNNVVVANGSILNCNDIYFGGGTLTISNATVQVRSLDQVGRSRRGGHIVFQGKSPLWYSSVNNAYFFAELADANVQFDFLVPVGGYEAAPIQGPASPSYSMGNNKGNPGACAYTVNVLDASPANFVDASVTTPLISWPRVNNKGGINTSLVVTGSLPAYGVGAVTDDEFLWSDNTATPATLSVVINGSSNSGKLQVSAAPAPCGADVVSPAYGYTAVANGAEQDCTAPAIGQLSETTRGICTGWKLYAVDPATLARTLLDAGDTAAYTFTGTSGWREFEWQWRLEHLVTVSASGGGTAGPSSQWVVHGETATLTAQPASGSVFSTWLDERTGAVYEANPLTIAVNTNLVLIARFGGDYYVSEQGSDENDGRTPETAFATVANALSHACATRGSRVTILPGAYSLAGDAYTYVSNRVAVVSSTGNPQDVTISIANGRGLYLADAESSVSGITIVPGVMQSGTRALLIDKGVASNCVVLGGSGSDLVVQINDGGEACDLVVDGSQGSNCAVIMLGGVLRRSVVRNCSGYTFGAVNALETGTATSRIIDCVVSNNVGQEVGGMRLAYVSVVEGCLISGNKATDPSYHYFRAAGILCRKGTQYISNTRVVGNVHTGSTGGISLAEGTAYMTNCLVAANSDKRAAGGIYNHGSRLHLVNCTVADNASPIAGGYNSDTSGNAANMPIVNCVFVGNTKSGATNDVGVPSGRTTPTITHSRYAEAVDGNADGNTSAPARLRDDYCPRRDSPCVDSGLPLGWTRRDKDLAGNRRLFGPRVDMGCFEAVFSPTEIILR